MSLILASCGTNDPQDNTLKIGHGGGYLSAAVYAAKEGLALDIQQFRSTSDIAYALFSGALDTGFVEAEKLAGLTALEGFNRLAVVGKVTYPYGATLVLRKGLDLRLPELTGLTVAASAPKCVLLGEFAKDARRLGADISGIKYEYMPFDAMLPAMEAGEADAIIIKGSYSVVALQGGHSILYQNWDVEPGDECCPAVIDQAALVLLARRDKLEEVKPFIDALLSAQKLPPDQLRRAVADNTVIPFNILKGQPVPEFSVADDELVKIFIEAADENHDGEDGEDGADE
jgi:ABC-type nitrate/sulfonate/bicarbonate transport system substrate-binding protein